MLHLLNPGRQSGYELSDEFGHFRIVSVLAGDRVFNGQVPRYRVEEVGLAQGLDQNVAATCGQAFVARGHEVRVLPDWTATVGGGQGIAVDSEEGSLMGGADPRVGEQLVQEASTSSDSLVSLPLFAKYTITVDGDTLRKPIEHEYEARPGANRQDGVDLATGLGPGTYSVSVFIHVQYVDDDDGPRILNNSAGFLQVEG